jgi:mannose-6-phosphate isomerase-like protein (cupin superfamily)
VTPEVRHPQEKEEYFFEEGCFILELSNVATDPEVSIARARVPGRGETRLHRLIDTTERYVILSGRGEATVGDLVSQVVPGDVVLIPAGAPQTIRNPGDDDLVFLAICSPRFLPECYQDLGPKE